MLKSKISLLFYTVFSILFFYLFFIFRSEISKTLSENIYYSFEVLIPSLFPMMFLSSFVSLSKASKFFSFVFSYPCERLLKLPKCCACAVVFGLCCGYPVGAKLSANLLKNNQITEEQANRICCFCVNAGIPFSVVFVGGVLLNSVKIGWLIFISNTVASLIIAVILAYKKSPIKAKNTLNTTLNFNECMKISSQNSLFATVNMCLYVLIFSCVLSVFRELGLINLIANFLSNFSVYSQKEYLLLINSFVEIVQGLNSTVCKSSEIFLIGLTFAGFCVHFQVFSFFPKGTIKFLNFYIAKILQIALSLEIYKLLRLIFPDILESFSSITPTQTHLINGNVGGSICLILVSIFYVLPCRKGRSEIDNL